MFGTVPTGTTPSTRLRARIPPRRTVIVVDPTAVYAEALTTAFVTSFVGRARPADPTDTDPARRASAWAHWAVTATTPMTGNSDRPYLALVLPGRFYDPKGTGPTVRPHLEIPAGVLARADVEFPDRLAQMGNGLLFPWWIVPEVLAVKRALFAGARASVGELVEVLNDRRGALVDALRTLNASAGASWAAVERLQVSRPDGLSAVATAPFSTEDVAAFFPPAADLSLEVLFDEKLAAANRGWASRRVGVWTIRGRDAAGDRFSLGVVTPRLTRSSLFGDPLFAPDRESPAALLVRGLVLRRLIRSELGDDAPAVAEPTAGPRAPAGPGLRAVVAHVGAAIPEASVPSAVHFLQTYGDPEAAWAALSAWAEGRGGDRRRAVLTVTREGFTAAHQAASRALRRAETPERDDINVVLPLAWDFKSRVVRVTFSHPPAGETDTD